MQKFCNGKNKGLALLDPFSYCFKMTLQKNVLLIDLRPCLHFFPNRSLLLGFSWGSKRGLPENTHKACSGHYRRPARDRKGPLKKRRGLP